MLAPEIYIGIMFGIGFVLIFGVGVVLALKRWLHDRRSPRITILAKVSEKEVEEHKVRRKNASGVGSSLKRIYYYYVTFTLENGNTVRLLVSKRIYNGLKKGKTGTLAYQGSKFVRFE